MDSDKKTANEGMKDEVIKRRKKVWRPAPKSDRITLMDIYMGLAVNVAHRSSCKRQGNGAVIVSSDFLHVYGIGYNGSVKKGPHNCNGKVGNCGCIHAEINAILKVNVKDDKKIMFCTSSPCMTCANYIIQSGFQLVLYHQKYRDITPIALLHSHGILCEQIWFSDQYVAFLKKFAKSFYKPFPDLKGFFGRDD